MALKKHKHHLKQRYIEVYKATGKDFVNVAGGNNTEAQAFLSRHNCHEQTIVRMRGLPYTATAEQVLQFFRSGDGPCEVLDGEDGVLFVRHPDGRSTGDAFVLFPNEDEAGKALAKHKQCIGTRYIELFKSTTAEVQQVLNNTAEARPQSELELQTQPLITQIPPQTIPCLPPPPQQAIICGSLRDCIRLRGLPFEAAVTDILTFLGEHSRNIVFQGVHMVYNAQGTFSGEAFIQMNSELAAEVAATNRHKKYMIIGNKKRYIEVLQCSGEDMNLILTNGLPPPMQQVPPAAAVTPPMTVQRPLMSPVPVSNGIMPGFPPNYPYPVNTTSPLPPAMSQAMAVNAGQMPQSIQAMNGLQQTLAAAAPRQPHFYPHAGHAPILYWYPSPPVSPQSSYYVHACPTVVVLKGLPLNTTAQDIMAFFDGVFEIPPDIQVQHGADGRQSGEAFVTFASRIEAERAVAERGRKPFGNRFVDLLIAQ